MQVIRLVRGEEQAQHSPADRPPPPPQISQDALFSARAEIGGSPSGSLALDRAGRAHAWLMGRDYVDPLDIRAIAPDVFRHRPTLSFEAQGDGVSANDVIARLLDRVALP